MIRKGDKRDSFSPDPVPVQSAIDRYGDGNDAAYTIASDEIDHIDANVTYKRAWEASLNESEKNALQWIETKYDLPYYVVRPNCGVDFATGQIGFEVKSDRDYGLTELQQQHCEVLPFVFVLVSVDGNVWVEDCYVDRGKTVRFTE